MNLWIISLAFAALFSYVAAECPNACSAHGKCGAYDMCICYRNWMANDCSERICQFGSAHVDSPKGDLDASSGALTGPGTTVVVNDAVYACGTTELYPNMVENVVTTTSTLTVLDNTAHDYMECSNKGLCDRATGQCSCFPGYEGSACQRASCPLSSAGFCSGHGTCKSIQQITALDSNNTYSLWDADATMGCVCDAGYTGADCSQRVCKAGADPLYHDDWDTVRYSNFTFQIYEVKTTTKNTTLVGNYSILFYDWMGKEWKTDPIDIRAGCTTIIDALEGLPNSVIPTDSVRCAQSLAAQQAIYGTSGSGYTATNGTNGQTPIDLTTGIPKPDAFQVPEVIYDGNMYLANKFTLAFTGNPGKLKQPKIDMNLDGARPTVYSYDRTFTADVDPHTYTVGSAVYPNGFAGEDTDLVPDQCEDLLVSIGAYDTTMTYRSLSFTAATAKADAAKLMTCLGDSDGDTSNNVDTYNWDYGNAVSSNIFTNPHLIKLVDATPYISSSTQELVSLVDRCCVARDTPMTKMCNGTFLSDSTTYGDITKSAMCEEKNPAGFYAVIFYNPAASTTLTTQATSSTGSSTTVVDGTGFYILTMTPSAAASTTPYSTSTKFLVYTTTGYLQLVSPNARVATYMTNSPVSSSAISNAEIIQSYFSNVLYMTPATAPGTYYGNIDCESNAAGSNSALDCLEKDDMIMVFDGTQPSQASTTQVRNPIYPDIYTVQRIGTDEYTQNVASHTTSEEGYRRKIVLDYGVNAKWGATSDIGPAMVYKFYPPAISKQYNYVGQCANRGLCDTTLGVCNCFSGYTGDNCAIQNALAK